MNAHQTRAAAMELTLHRLTNKQPGAVYDELTRLCPGGIDDLMAVTVHLATAMAAVLVQDCGSQDAAVVAIQKQIKEGGH